MLPLDMITDGVALGVLAMLALLVEDLVDVVELVDDEALPVGMPLLPSLQVLSDLKARCGPSVTLLQPGRRGMSPITGSLANIGKGFWGGQLLPERLSLDLARGAHSSMAPLLVFRQSLTASLSTSSFQPLRKSPWKP